MAFQKILDSHLSAKYSYLGRLGSTDCLFRKVVFTTIQFCLKECNNITTDGFYDMGPVREGGKFLTIDELSAQEVNDRRPILLLYALEKK